MKSEVIILASKMSAIINHIAHISPFRCHKIINTNKNSNERKRKPIILSKFKLK